MNSQKNMPAVSRGVPGEIGRGARAAFTLVELLVVIGIIALLIAILMPALSRARKQALQVSCGSNERQIAYAAIAYGNDWKQQLPTRVGGFPGRRDLFETVRLPIIGFDTVTVLDWAALAGAGVGGCSMARTPEGWAYMMRDYLKNDFDINQCPDGWFRQQLNRFNATYCYPLIYQEYTYGSGPGDPIDAAKPSYYWVLHRPDTSRDIGGGPFCECGGTACQVDTSKDIAKTADHPPDLVIIADMILAITGEGYPFTGVPLLTNHPYSAVSSHSATTSTERARIPRANLCNLGATDPNSLPLGSNRARIDCRTTWVASQDLTWTRYRAVDKENWDIW